MNSAPTKSVRVADQVRVELIRRGKTVAELSKAIDLSPNSLYRRFGGRSSFTLEELDQIASFLEVPVADLMARAVGDVA